MTLPFDVSRLPGLVVSDGYTTGLRDNVKDWTRIPKPRTPRTCARCGVEYMPKYHGQRYCDDCRRDRDVKGKARAMGHGGERMEDDAEGKVPSLRSGREAGA